MMKRFALPGLAVALAACGWNPSRPFDRDAPLVSEAVQQIDGGDASAAASALEEYLSTGPCKEGNIGAPDSLKRRPDGTIDLGLALFRVAEGFGRRFGEDEPPGSHPDENLHEARHVQVECARRIVQAVTDDADVDATGRAEARYLEGNLAFLDGEYEEAVSAYDRALRLAPGEVDGGAIGQDAAWNRAIALRRKEDQKDAGNPGDASRPGDAGHESSPDSGSGGQDGSSGAPPDSGPPNQDDDASPPAPQPPPDAGNEPEAGAPPPPASESQDDRMLDRLENARTFQQEEARRSRKRPPAGMDK